MNHKQTQIEHIRKKLLKEGYVTNLYAINHHIWRLSDIIFRLRGEGMEIETIYKNKKGERNTKYVLVKKT